MARQVSGINPRRRTSHTKPHVPIPAEQHLKLQEAGRQRREELDAALSAWESYTLSKAEELTERFDKKPRYFLDLFYQATARLASRHEKVNGFNAYKSKRISEMRESTYASLIVVTLLNARVIRW